MLNMVKRPSRNAYDYIIIGSGSAGSTVACRLSECKSKNILLIEAGASDRNIFIQMPAGLGIPLMKDRYNWKFFAEKDDTSKSTKGPYTPRGKVLGGSSSINGMNWVRGNKADYDSWRDFGLSSWSYAHCLPYFKRSENYQEGDSVYRGKSGPTKIIKAEASNPLFQAYIQAAIEYGLTLNQDHNGENQIGVHKTQRNVADGIRHSASQAYLYDQPDKPNLEVLMETRCTSIEFSGADAVKVHLTRQGENFSIEVAGELILAAGAIQSPQLLMLAGIGDKNMLADAGIAARQHMQGVGANLQDHPAWCFEFGATNPNDSLASELSYFGRLKLGVQWLLGKRGLGISNHFEVGAFLCLMENQITPEVQMECIAMRGDFAPDGIKVEPGFQCFTSLQRPTSRGKIWIENANPITAPKFQFNYLNTDYDRNIAVDAIKATRGIFQQRAWNGRLTAELSGVDQLASDSEIMQWAYAHVESNYHPCGTCRMGNDDLAVTDEFGKVHGFDNLRIIDASIIPSIPTGNLNAITIMIAEKIADSILGLAPLEPEFL
ncbi:MAG: GMC family oxidoreductase N-terminal domain-containing protein [Porticoccaceae bacterium]